MADIPVIKSDQPWRSLFDGDTRRDLEQALPAFLAGRRWFAGKARALTDAKFLDWSTPGSPPDAVVLTIVRVAYADGGADRYFVPLAFLADARDRPDGSAAASTLVRIDGAAGGSMVDALADDGACRALVAALLDNHRMPMHGGAAQFSAYDGGAGPRGAWPIVRTSAEQSNSCVVFGDQYVLKLLRRLESGPNPEVEISRFLSGRGFTSVPPLAAILEYEASGAHATSLALLQRFVPNQGTAWDHAVADVKRYLGQTVQPTSYLTSAAKLGLRTAELHLALAHDNGDPAFAPVAFGAEDRAAKAASVQREAASTFALLAERLAALPDAARARARDVLDARVALAGRLGALAGLPAQSTRTRVHGDYHLGQVLQVNDDFVIIDFEGEPARSLAERRAKESPLKDVAGMLRSFGYAAYGTLLKESAGQPDHFARLEPRARAWEAQASAAFLSQYRFATAEASLVPTDDAAFSQLLEVFVLEKVLYELAYELASRPAWVEIPLLGISRILGRGAGPAVP